MSFPPQFLDELRARLRLSDRIGRAVRLARRGREHVGLCPFHQEKTPSFTVSDEKGFFHCFGCGAHGDIIGFAMQHDGLTFPDAVGVLAAEAGLSVPEPSPEARAQARLRESVQEALEFAAGWFARALVRRDEPAGARYLNGRGVSAEMISRFRLGYAPVSGRALAAVLKGEGISETLACEAGLLRRHDGGRADRDFFFGRVMFPITDRRNHVIGFGARSLGEAQPKYLNSPESPVFRKRRTLFNLAGARKPARDAERVVVAEGYMDVIALVQAGIKHAVAPLGTALSAEQLQELWRLAAEPVLCLDGDRAGRAAAVRAAAGALPLLKPGQSLAFVFLPEGDDPDSLLRRAGAGALRERLAAAAPLADLIWRDLTAGKTANTPERRAGLRQAIDARLQEIADERVRAQYRQAFRARFDAAYSPPRHRGWRPDAEGQRRDGGRPGAWEHGAPAPPPDDGARRERLMLATLLNHPELLAVVAEELAGMDFRTEGLRRLSGVLIDFAAAAADMADDKCSAALRERLAAADALGYADRLLWPDEWDGGHLAESFARADASAEAALAGFRHLAARHRRQAVLADLQAAEDALSERMDKESLARLVHLQQQLSSLDKLEENAGRSAGP